MLVYATLAENGSSVADMLDSPCVENTTQSNLLIQTFYPIRSGAYLPG